MKQKKLPHWEESFKVINAAFDKVGKKYDDVIFSSETSMDYHNIKTKLYKLLDSGCDTIVLISPMVIYSHFEEFNSSFYHCFEYIHEWQQENPGKEIKIIMAPQMGSFQPVRQAFLDMLEDRLDTIPKDSDVFVAVTVHGMPWDNFSWEAWLDLAPEYRDKLHEEIKDLLKSYEFKRTKTVLCQDEFASHVWDHDDNYLSTREAYQIAIDEKYDYAIGLPIEFFAENSDTLFYHAIKNYENFDEYDIYEQFDYPDWSLPFTMEFKQKDTMVIYNGVPVGKYQKHIIEAFYLAVDSVLAQKK
jgi:protoheme ferro-lyase